MKKMIAITSDITTEPRSRGRKAGTKKIICSKCQSLKSEYSYDLHARTATSPICRRCADYVGSFKDKGIILELSDKVCLVCERPFLSENGSRVCKKCRKKKNF